MNGPSERPEADTADDAVSAAANEQAAEKGGESAEDDCSDAGGRAKQDASAGQEYRTRHRPLERRLI